MARNAQYWQFVNAIWANVTDATFRLVFADWLEEHGMISAGKRQRMYAKFIEQSVVIFERMESARKTVTGKGRRYKQSQVRYVYGIIDRPKQSHMQDFEIKRDGTIVLSPPGMKRGIGPRSFGSKILSGRWLPPNYPRFSLQGTIRGRFSGSSPSVSGILKSSGTPTGGNPCSELLLEFGTGSPDSIANGQLFDYEKIRASASPLKNLFRPSLGKAKDEGSWGIAKPLEPEMLKKGMIDVKYLPNTREGWTELVQFILNGYEPLKSEFKKKQDELISALGGKTSI